MDFGKYIHELLLDNEVVIIPGFGAFVSEYKPAELSNDNEEMKPPSKTVSFNQQIRNNDGLLVGLVAEKKRISHFDALKRIEREREDILYKLDNGEQVDVDEVGILYYTEENAIAFKAEADENLLLDSFGLESTAIAIESETKEDVIVADRPDALDETSEPTSEKSEEEVAHAEEEPIVEEEYNKELDKEPEPFAVNPPIKMAEAEEPEEKKKKRSWLWLLLVLIPLVIASIFIYMKKDNAPVLNEEKAGNTEVQTVEEPATLVLDTTKADSVMQVYEDTTVRAEPDSISIKTTNEVEEENRVTPRYYLVGGSFSVKENAETYLNELKAKGFDAFHVGKKGRFFIVGIASYDTFGQAEKAKKEYMDNNPGSEVWVYKK